jgi:hypothetical protein
MANRKISDLTALTAPATGDLLPIVDISEAAAADKNKKITYGELFASIPLGTAAAPSIAFEGDSNTGIYSPGADTIATVVGGTAAFHIDSSGRVGIGSTLSGNANNRLLVRSESASAITDVLLLLNGAANNNAGQGVRINLSGISETNSNIRYAYIEAATEGTANNHYLAFGTNSSGSSPVERARIDSSGRLLVGTSSDSGGALLQVNGDRIRIGTAKTPASATATGTTGEIAWDANYIYVCTATNTWKRTAISTW